MQACHADTNYWIQLLGACNEKKTVLDKCFRAQKKVRGWIVLEISQHASSRARLMMAGQTKGEPRECTGGPRKNRAHLEGARRWSRGPPAVQVMCDGQPNDDPRRVELRIAKMSPAVSPPVSQPGPNPSLGGRVSRSRADTPRSREHAAPHSDLTCALSAHWLSAQCTASEQKGSSPATALCGPRLQRGTSREEDPRMSVLPMSRTTQYFRYRTPGSAHRCVHGDTTSYLWGFIGMELSRECARCREPARG